MEPGADHARLVYDDSYFSGGDAGYPDYLAEGALLRRRGQWYGRLMARYTQAGAVLDMGAAAGFILQGFQDTGWTGMGVEPNAEMARYGRERLSLDIECSTCEGFRSSRHFDLVSMIQVVAHLTDIRRAFQVCAGALKPGGLLLIESWNRRSWTARLLGKNWHEYSPPSVLRWFSPEDLEMLLRQFGFAKIAQGRPPKRILGAHAKTLLDYKLREWPLGATLGRITKVIPDGAEIPYPAEDLFWALFRL
jgi:SAM-dependent methyltransferase